MIWSLQATSQVFGSTQQSHPSTPTDEMSLVEKALFDPAKHHTVRVISTQDFMREVQDLNNPFWLVREFVQNFVDGNIGSNAHSLNGVNCETTGNSVKISADWTIESFENLITLGTNKILVDERGSPCADLSKAGGIGIGIKQCALTMLRDQGIENFEIQGKDWVVKYRLVDPEEINQKLQQKGINHKIQGSYFIAEVEKLETPQEKCSYKLEANNSKGKDTLKAFQHFHDIGEHRHHPALQKLDFTCNCGSIKWLQTTDSGALFMNGQRRSYLRDNRDGSFRGTGGMTVSIHNEIPRNFHRGPISANTLSTFVRPIIEAMDVETAKIQLKKSFPLWSNTSWNQYDCEREGYQVVIDELIDKLSLNDFSLNDLQVLFPGTKFICISESISAREKEKLLQAESEDCATLVYCPQSFRKIGVPYVELDGALKDYPAAPANINIRAINQQARMASATTGIPVNYEPIEGLQNSAEIFDLMSLRLQAAPIKESGQNSPINEIVNLGNGKFRIYMNTTVDDQLLTSQFLRSNQYTNPLQRSEAEYLLFLRGLAHYGISNGVVESVRCMLNDTIIDHLTAPGDGSAGDLIIRTQRSYREPSVEFIELQIKPEYIEEFRERFVTKLGLSCRTVDIQETAKPKSHKPSTRVDDNFSYDPKRENMIMIGSLGIIVAVFVGGALWVNSLINSTKHTPPKPSNTTQQASADVLDKLADEVDKTSRKSQRIPLNQNTYRIARSLTDDYANIGNTGDGLTLDEFTDQQETAAVESRTNQEETDEEKRIRRLQATLAQIEKPEHIVEDFKPVLFPTELEKHKIELLKTFMHLATGVKQDYDLFIFEGKGALGINLPGQGGIGLHRSLLQLRISEALGTLSHELSHEKGVGNYKHGDPTFYKRLKVLLSTTVNKLIEIANKPMGERSQDENELLDIAKQWNEINPVEDPAKTIR